MPDRSHAANAKARAHQQLNAGHLSSSAYHHVVAKANKLLDHHAIERAKRKGRHHHISRHGHDDAHHHMASHEYGMSAAHRLRRAAEEMEHHERAEGRYGYHHHHISKHGYDDAHMRAAHHPAPYYDEHGGGGRPFWSHHSSERPDHFGHPHPGRHPTDHHDNPHYAVHGHEPHSRDDHYHVGKGRFDRLTVPEHSRSVVASIPSHANKHDRPDMPGGRRDRYGMVHDHTELYRHETVAHEGRNPPNQTKHMGEGHDDGYDGTRATYNANIFGHDNVSRHSERADHYARDRQAHQLYRHERVAHEHRDTHHPNLAKPMSVGHDDGYSGTDGGPHSTYNQGIFDRINRR
jgi:hypothetical protein